MKVKPKMPYKDSKTVFFEGKTVSFKNPTIRKTEELLMKGVVCRLRIEDIEWFKDFSDKSLKKLTDEEATKVMSRWERKVTGLIATEEGENTLKLTVNYLDDYIVQINYFIWEKGKEQYELTLLLNTKNFPVVYDVVHSSKGSITLSDVNEIAPSVAYFYVASILYMDNFKFCISDEAKVNEKICSIIPVKIFEKDPWD